MQTTAWSLAHKNATCGPTCAPEHTPSLDAWILQSVSAAYEQLIETVGTLWQVNLCLTTCQSTSNFKWWIHAVTMHRMGYISL